MPAKRDATTELADKMLRVLESQRDLGTNAYPTTLRRLAELADHTADTQSVQKAVKKKTFVDRTVVAQAKNLDSPIVLVEDADQLAESPAFLEYLLVSLCTTTNPTVDVSKLKKKAALSVKEAFGRSLDRRIADNALPPGVAVIKVKAKLHLHLLRYPLPRKPEEVLAEKLVKVLQAQRQLGDDAYPISLMHLIELTRPEANDALVKKVIAHSTFKGAVVQAMKEAEAPVALAEDIELLANSPVLLVMALQKVRSETNHLFTPAKLKAKVLDTLRKAFEKSIVRRAEDGQLPQGVGRLLQKKRPLLFLMSDIVSGNVATGEQTRSVPAQPAASGVNHPNTVHGNVKLISGQVEPVQTPVAAPKSAAEFAHAFEEAFRRLDEQSRSHNFVSLLDLRRGLPFDRPAFDAGLRELRRAGRYSLSAAEGRQGVSPEEQEAGIIEDGALLLYVSRKLT